MIPFRLDLNLEAPSHLASLVYQYVVTRTGLWEPREGPFPWLFHWGVESGETVLKCLHCVLQKHLIKCVGLPGVTLLP